MQVGVTLTPPPPQKTDRLGSYSTFLMLFIFCVFQHLKNVDAHSQIWLISKGKKTSAHWSIKEIAQSEIECGCVFIFKHVWQDHPDTITRSYFKMGEQNASK